MGGHRDDGRGGAGASGRVEFAIDAMEHRARLVRAEAHVESLVNSGESEAGGAPGIIAINVRAPAVHVHVEPSLSSMRGPPIWWTIGKSRRPRTHFQAIRRIAEETRLFDIPPAQVRVLAGYAQGRVATTRRVGARPPAIRRDGRLRRGTWIAKGRGTD